MIAYLAGKLVFKSPEYIILDISGVGFRIHVPLSTYYHLPEINSALKLNIYMQVREDAFSLYGFLGKIELEAFEVLISVAGIGPRVATNMLSELSVGEIKSAIAGENLRTLTSISGIGKKLAQRIILEVKEKMENVITEHSGSDARHEVTEDAITALISLGYTPGDARSSVSRALKEKPEGLAIEKLIKQALVYLRQD